MKVLYKKGSAFNFKFDFCPDDGLDVDIETVADEVADELVLEGWSDTPWEAHGIDDQGNAVEPAKRKRRTKAEMEAETQE